MRFCTHCGSQLETGAKFCTACGTATAPPAQPTPASTPQPPQPVGVQPQPKARSGILAPLLLLGAAVLALAVVGTALLLNRGPGDDGTEAVPGPSAVSATSVTPPPSSTATSGSPTSAPSSSSSGSASTTVTTATPSASPSPTDGDGLAALQPSNDADAHSILTRVREADRSTTPDDTWVAQVASQYKGVEDTSVQPGPMSISDVLRHHRGLRQDPRFAGHKVILVKADDFGKRKKRDHEIWVTLVLLNKSSGADVKGWCVSTFPSLTGDALRNTCYERQYTDPHD